MSGLFEQQKKPRRIHFIGIGGIGLSAIARWFLSEGWRVSGSDLVKSQITDDLRRDGVRITYGDKPSQVVGADFVVVSQAIPLGSPSYKEAKKRSIPILARPTVIGNLSRRYDTVAIAGAHGKSTTTALTALLLIKMGVDPTVIVGTKLREFRAHNFRKGRGPVLVLEADEYGRAFLEYSPLYAIITNIDREHLDIYENLQNIKAAFMEFAGNVRPGGALVLNADDANLASLRDRLRKAAKKNRVRLFWYSLRSPKARKIQASLQVPGRHNVSNALAVHVLATKILGLPERAVLETFRNFRGTWRRAEYRGTVRSNGVKYAVYDDYAHHPTEIKTTLKGFREKFPGASIVCVFQPHQADRLKRLFKEFKTAFGDAHALLFLPEYRVSGREERPTPFTSRALALAIKKKHPKQLVRYVEDPKKFGRKAVLNLLPEMKTKNAVVIMMGAGNIVDLTPKLLKNANG